MDVRPAATFAAAHLRNSINIGLEGQYASWAGTFMSMDRPIVILSALGAEREAVTRLGRIGLDNVIGFIDGGVDARLAERPDLAESFTCMSATDLAEHISSEPDTLLLDVRSAAERRSVLVEASHHIPLSGLLERWQELPRNRPILVLCASGYRSTIAASLLRQRGFGGVGVVLGSAVEVQQGIAQHS